MGCCDLSTMSISCRRVYHAKVAYHCNLCGHRFGDEDVAALRFFPDTLICDSCYRWGRSQPYRVWCFGKCDLVWRGKIVAKGYDPKAETCERDGGSCPDRFYCRLYQIRRMGRLQRLVEKGRNVL